jgi:hypothetical protein
MPAIPVIWEDHNFEAILGNLARLCPKIKMAKRGGRVGKNFLIHNLGTIQLKKRQPGMAHACMPVIPATQEAKIRRISV